MIRDIILGALAASALTTETGRKTLVGAGKIGLTLLERNLKNNYNIDVKSLLTDEEVPEKSAETESECEDNA